MRRRFTILGMMGLVGSVAVAIAALRGANEYWASGLMLGVPFIACIALVAGVCGKAAARSRRLGFAIFAGVYYALIFIGLNDANVAKLPTSKLLWTIHERAAGRQTLSVVFTTAAGPGSGNGTVLVQGTSRVQYTLANVMTSTASVPVVSEAPGPPNRWRTMLPGAADYEPFSIVGHCLIAVALGLVGAMIAAFYSRGRSGHSASSAAATASDGGVRTGAGSSTTGPTAFST